MASEQAIKAAKAIIPIPESLANSIEDMPFLADVFPYHFGGSTLGQIVVACASCQVELDQNTIRGEIHLVANGTAAHMIAYGICYRCHTITPVEAKLHNDGIVLYRSPGGWAKQSWGNPKESLVNSLSAFIKRRWQQFLPPVIALSIAVGWFLSKFGC